VRRVHRSGSYVLPMPEGKDVKKALYRVLRQRSMREKITIENRLMPVRVLTDGGRAVGAAALNSRTGEFVAVAAKAVILATGACGRLGLPARVICTALAKTPLTQATAIRWPITRVPNCRVSSVSR
jgi:succinate dehydrogenase/fumarate reductase flavoprotein subunit